MKAHPREWIEVRPEGLYCKPAQTYIDPTRPVDRAIVTHGHNDHAKSGHQEVIATPHTLQIMACRYGDAFTEKQTRLDYHQPITLGGVTVTLYPAGHVLGSAQVLIEYGGSRLVVSGDYRCKADNATCVPFECVPCDVFITEATFALPVFIHPPIEQEIQKLIRSLKLFPERCHLTGAYALGKAQRVISALRAEGYTKAIYLHGALVKLCQLYQKAGIELGELIPVSAAKDKNFAGEIVMCPPGALADKWSRRFPNILPCMASGWMQIRARAKQRRIELPLVISDHADWNELTQTIHAVGAQEIWITHGREEALMHYAQQKGIQASALSLIGYEEDAE